MLRLFIFAILGNIMASLCLLLFINFLNVSFSLFVFTAAPNSYLLIFLY